MRRRILLITTVLIVLLVATNVSSVLGCARKLYSGLIAGQHYDAGLVTIWFEGGYLYVYVTPGPDWSLGETQLYVDEVPPTKAAPGKFPHTGTNWYKIPLANEPTCDDPIYVALHAVVSKDGQIETETAWADSYGIPFGKGWAMYLEFPSGPLCP